MSNDRPFTIPEGAVPVVEVHGTSFQCGEQLGVYWRQPLQEAYTFPDGERPWFDRSDTAEAKAFDRHAPHIRELYRAMIKSAGITTAREKPVLQTKPTACSSYGMQGDWTADGSPLAGQNKDTGWGSALRYIVLKVCSTDGPGPFTLTYPLDLVGYGSSATGLCIFRNGMPGPDGPGFAWMSWALIAKCKPRVKEAIELFHELDVGGCANVLLADRFGGLIDIEFGERGNHLIKSADGLLVHTNHFVNDPVAPKNDSIEYDHSVHRAEVMRKRFSAERGRHTWVSALHCMSDHEKYPLSLCRHSAPHKPGFMTTASIVAEPAKGRLHVVRGNPCSNPPVTHAMQTWDR